MTTPADELDPKAVELFDLRRQGERLRAAAEQSVAGGLVAYVHRLRENHAATVTPEGRLGVCRCGEPGCAKALLLLHIDDLLAAYQLKVDDFARETAEVERWKGRYVFVKSEYDRLILERRVESGTA
jgi:hypothetical protein